MMGSPIRSTNQKFRMKDDGKMSATDVKEIVYHCECRRFVLGTPAGACLCHECGQELEPAGFASPGTTGTGV